jgi:EC042_2821-lke REase
VIARTLPHADNLDVAANDELVAEALKARKESRHVEFVARRPPWPELLKDVAAMANSGGGVIVLGRNADGSDAGWDAALDRAEMIDAFAPFVGERFDDFSVVASTNGSRFAVIIVPPRLHAPLVFEKAGTYTDAQSREKTAFARGTIYFRHGSRSAPGTARDVQRFILHELDDQRRGWARNVRKVASAPRDAQVLVVKPRQATLPEVRVVDDPNAPTLARTDFDLTHPYRQTEVVRTVNERVGRKLVSGYDLQCVRKVYDVAHRPEFFHQPKFGSPQYSEAFVSWLVSEWQKDAEFFAKAKAIVRPKRVTEN